MAQDKEIIFRFDAYTPETIPMERLAAYLAQLGALLGEQAGVHFARLEPGSTSAVCRVEREAVPKVDERLSRVKVGDGPEEARKAARIIDDMLRRDNASGSLLEAGGPEIIPFPGSNRIAEPTYGPFNQPGAIDGVVIRLGGKGKFVPVTLLDRAGAEIHCSASRETARELAKHIFGAEVRCNGDGRWFRATDGEWELRQFTISAFEMLDNRPLSDVVAELRSVKGNEWRRVDDPWSELARTREDGHDDE
ncbi:MAG: hypothetical protein NTV97_00595 [Alphaproteobacteria bacterium]|nr:hypothetical protein [Alphaproteobacteria bacterium]